jgi:hypothetical protein
MDVGIIVLCPNRNPAALKNSVGGIRHHCLNREVIAAIPTGTPISVSKELKQYCPVYKGKDTITSLVNIGMKRLSNTWGFVIFSGSRVPKFVEKKWNFATSDKDVLYPIVDMKCNFVDGSFNGVLINKAFFQEVGDFPDVPMEKPGLNDFEFAKLLWATKALEAGVLFKGIVGMKVI